MEKPTTFLIAICVGLAACSSKPSEPPRPNRPPAMPLPSGTPSQPPLLPQRGPVARLDGFMGLSFYPGSEDTKPAASNPNPETPSVRTTPDEVDKVAVFYKTRLSNTAQETHKGKTVVVEGRTPAGDVQILIEPTGNHTQITMRRK